MKRWVCTFGVPEHTYFDPGGGNISDEMTKGLVTDRTTPLPCAGQAHWEVGTIERGANAFDEKLEQMLDQFQPTNAEERCEIVYKTCAGKNEFLREHGFSANQHLFGRQPKIPVDILDLYNCPVSMAIATDDDRMARSVEIRDAARRCWLEAKDARP